MHRFALAVLLVSVAFGQDLDRVFHLTNSTSAESLQDIVTTMRTVAQIQRVSADTNVAEITVKGTANQIALAEWLIPKLDVSPGSTPGPQSYRIAGDNDDVVELFELTNASTMQTIQEVLTTLRTVADIGKVYQVSGPRIIMLRGNSSQIALAEFLIPLVDQPVQPRQNPTVHAFQMTGVPNEIAIVYGLAHAEKNLDLQQILTSLRTVLDIQKIYQVSAPRYLVMHDNANTIQMAEWLIRKLDKQTADTAGNEARMPGGKDDVVHVFYLQHVTSDDGTNRLLTEIRKTTHIMKAYTRSTPPALVLRGMADQIAMAAKMIEFGDQEAAR
jgi:hypothetical protein